MIYATASRGIAWPTVEELELWQLASALGIHRVETIADRDKREIIDEKAEYWEATKEARLAKLDSYSQRRAERKRERAKGRGRDV